MNTTARTELLTRLRIQRRTRLAKRGDLGAAIKALHDTADAMDARQRRMSPYRTPGGRMYWPVERHEAHNVLMVAEHGVFGAASMREFENEWRQRKQQDRIAAGQWLKRGIAALKSIEPLLVPDGYDSPDLSSGDLRAIAGRLAAEAIPLPSDVNLAA
ncbi:hypothetical protein [Streptomyces nigrescens]|uniref:hypothetical protein n=1 Tax=Streptomyces nigrescens TaxID=1920 RepID=UPI0036FB637C